MAKVIHIYQQVESPVIHKLKQLDEKRAKKTIEKWNKKITSEPQEKRKQIL